MRSSASVAAILIGTLSVACDRSGQPAGEYSVRDSAGVAIAESAAPAWTDGEAWTLAEAPHVEIGASDEPGHDLYEVTGVVRLSDGRIAVGNSGSSEIRIFSSDGQLVGTIGGPGEGPGEFRSLRRLFLLPGDSLLATDTRLDRLTVFTSDGEIVRTAQIAAPPSGAIPSPSVRLRDGSLIALPPFSFGSSSGGTSRVIQDTVPLMRYDGAGGYVGELGRFPGSEYFIYMEGSNILGGQRVWGRQTHTAAAGDGFIVGGLTPEYAYEVHARDGTLLRHVRAERPARSVSSADIARMKEPDPDASPGSDQIWGRVLDAIPPPSTFPPYAAIVAEDDGHVWIRDYIWPEDEATRQEWQVFDPDGRWLGTVTMPAGFRALHIGADEVLGIYRDDMDVEHLQAYRLTREAR